MSEIHKFLLQIGNIDLGKLTSGCSGRGQPLGFAHNA